MGNIFLALLILVAPIHAFGQDLERNNPERKAILDSVRASYPYLSKDDKFAVKRIWASDQWAYLCALIIDKDGIYQGTDGGVDVTQMVLSKRGNQWVPVAEFG